MSSSVFIPNSIVLTLSIHSYITQKSQGMVSDTHCLLTHLINARLVFLDEDHVSLFPALIPPLAQAATLQMCDVRQPRGVTQQLMLDSEKIYSFHLENQLEYLYSMGRKSYPKATMLCLLLYVFNFSFIFSQH